MRTEDIFHKLAKRDTKAARPQPKVRTLYEVRRYTGVGCSERLGRKLRPRARAFALVCRLKSRGIDAYAAPLRITVMVTP